MHAEKENYAITRMARLLKVARAGYYAWARRLSTEPGPGKQAQRVLDAGVARVHAESDDVFGASRIQTQLARQAVTVNEKTVAKSMHRQGLEGISPRKFRPVTTLPGARTHRIPDRVERVWDLGVVDEVWISDINYLRTWEGFVYLCVIRNGCSRRVLGRAMDNRQDSDLVEQALRMAHTLRRIASKKVILHAERGAQYNSGQLHRAAGELGLAQSVGRTGACWDNTMPGSFWSTLKTEFYDRRIWASRSAVRREVGQWIEEVYNRRRLHSALGQVTPVEFEEARSLTDLVSEKEVSTQAG